MKTRVLMVDDCADNLRYLTQIISSEEIDIYSAQSEDEALRLLLDHRFALALVKVKMPMMDGVELIRLFRNLKSDHYVPTILIDLKESKALDYFEAYNAGVVDCLTHPVDVHALKNKIAVFVRLDQQRMRLQELRGPIVSVVEFAELLRSEDLDQAERKRISESILRNGEDILRKMDYI